MPLLLYQPTAKVGYARGAPHDRSSGMARGGIDSIRQTIEMMRPDKRYVME
jgi:hypothetical protein